ncbi:MAG: hypothetical protein HY680_01440 [Chloroflexi bacterium]|nr:hypothetical protein [Chloroflexota bacterium]
MPLRLTGEPFIPIQGADGQGWVREVTAADGTPGLKVNQQGAGRVFDFQDGGASKLFLPDGGSVSIVGSLLFDLANDVTITPANPAAPRTVTIPDPGGNDSFAFLAATQTLTGKTLTSPVIQGTVGAGSGLTMPAFGMTGNLAFQQASTLSTTTGDLVLNPASKVLMTPTDKLEVRRADGAVGLRLADAAGNSRLDVSGVAGGDPEVVLSSNNNFDLVLEPKNVDNAFLVLRSSKSTTGDPTAKEGMVYINTYDNAVRMYADGAWRTLASW